MMTYDTILRAAMAQSAVDLNCAAEDFGLTENQAVLSAPDDRARNYLELPFYCQLVSYGSNVVASASEEFLPSVRQYIDKYGAVRCFETPQMHVLNDELEKRGYRVCFMAEYFLPDPAVMRPLTCAYECRVLTPDEFALYYTPSFSNALCERRKQYDVLAVGAYDGEKLIGLAGASADCDTMWQIGVDVLPEYRRQGVGSAITSRLAYEIMARDKVPFYCAAWSNVRSVRNAVKSGFLPAWVEMTAKSRAFVDKMNGVI